MDMDVRFMGGVLVHAQSANRDFRKVDWSSVLSLFSNQPGKTTIGTAVMLARSVPKIVLGGSIPSTIGDETGKGGNEPFVWIDCGFSPFNFEVPLDLGR